MKILQVIPYYWPATSFGGPVKVVYELIEELLKKNNVTVYTSDALNDKRRISDKEKVKSRKGISVYYFKNIINHIAFSLRIYTNFSIVTEYLKSKNDFDIIHIHDVFSLPQILLAFIARIYNKPYVISTHGIDVSGRNTGSLMKYFFYIMFVKKMLFESKSIIATSNEEATVLRKNGFENVKTVYNGVSNKRNNPSSKFEEYNQKEVFTVLYIGRINRLKGIDRLIESLRDISFPIQLLIAGPDDGEEKRLISLAQNLHLEGKVHFLGFVNENEKEELYKVSDVFVYPSSLEGFSISILEAMQHSLPVIITDACNFPDVGKYDAGVILSSKNLATELSISLNRLYIKDMESKIMGKSAKRLVLEKYSIDKMVIKIEKIYENAIKK